MDNVRDILVNYKNSLVSSGVWNPKIMKCYDLQYPSMTLKREVYLWEKKILERADHLLGAKSQGKNCHEQSGNESSPYSLPALTHGVQSGGQKLSNCPMPGPQEPHDLDTRGLTPGFVVLFLIFYRRIPKVTSSQFTMAPWLQTGALLTADMKNKIAPWTQPAFDSRFS